MVSTQLLRVKPMPTMEHMYRYTTVYTQAQIYIYIGVCVKHCLFTITWHHLGIWMRSLHITTLIDERPVADVDQLLQKWPNSVPHLPRA